MDWKSYYKDRLVTSDEAIANIKPNDRVFLSGNVTTPNHLVQALAKRAPSLSNIELNHLLTFGEDPFINIPQVFNNAWFLGPSIRKAVNEGKSQYIPIFLREIATLVRSGNWDINVALINVSPPDRFGFMSYGAEVSITKPCAEAAKIVIAQVNNLMPRTLGDSFLHVNEVDFFVEMDEPLVELPAKPASAVELEIGQRIAAIIEDGSTLQMGIGGIPNAVLQSLGSKTGLGIHTEMLSDGVLPLLESGVINNQNKGIHRGKTITGFAMGSKKLYDYIDNNPMFEFRPSHFTNDPFMIAQNNKMVAINSAIEVDLTGQVVADSIGTNIYSGIGGQLDFIRGAARARNEGGKPIIALPSTAKSGKESRITPFIKQGAGVVTSRGDVHFVATEYGIVDLFGKNLKQRAELLISIAHPDFREQLTKEAHWLNLS
ncbi:acetyl-CoA hydrolase/transferase family protein [Leptospira sp. GIMC2001]|uniref:acetyl-CoA hydrolase/transferase family protein n=1 Tax=Leptospira sp. GIMC2001 TaxID=1513297 RepID=UPI00234BBB14|nr:acetyl-CoA hydrolase/transferase C-terminal domain-containing protein [Leptospira sp. GIMC2001]WCL48628.1 4-hydroxybutyrate CoA-transferase [Leptospira sp. GIMC2001]